MQNLEILEPDKSSLVNLGYSVPGQVDLLEPGRVHEKVFRQSCHFVVSKWQNFETIKPEKSLVGDVSNFVWVETEELEPGLTGEGVVGHGHDVVVAQVNLHKLGQEPEKKRKKA